MSKSLCLIVIGTRTAGHVMFGLPTGLEDFTKFKAVRFWGIRTPSKHRQILFSLLPMHRASKRIDHAMLKTSKEETDA